MARFNLKFVRWFCEVWNRSGSLTEVSVAVSRYARPMGPDEVARLADYLRRLYVPGLKAMPVPDLPAYAEPEPADRPAAADELDVLLDGYFRHELAHLLAGWPGQKLFDRGP